MDLSKYDIEELDEYYNDTLLDAFILCIGFGLDAGDLLSCSISAFGRIYRSVRRIETYRHVAECDHMRAAPNASLEEYQEYSESLTSWLHPIERAAMKRTSKGSAKTKTKNQGAASFMKDFKQDFKADLHG